VDVVTADTYQQAVVEASHDLPVLVDFWGPSCGPCLKMMPWVEAFAAAQSSRLKIVKLNSMENRRFCFNLRVMGLPAFLLYQNGMEVRRLSGDECTPTTIVETLAAVVPHWPAQDAGAT
jgi:thioredoxin 1